MAFEITHITRFTLFWSIVLNLFLMYSVTCGIQDSDQDTRHASIAPLGSSKPRNIFEHGRIHNHLWTPLDPSESKDINLVDDLGDWIRDKTILLVGDSVDRRTVQWLCSYKHWNLTTGSFPENDGWTDCGGYNACSRVCNSVDLNTTIVNAFLVGLNPDDSLRRRTGHHFPYNQTMDPKRRLTEVYVPFIKDVLKREADVVVFNSGYVFTLN